MNKIKEGTLYKLITLHGKTFEIYYGYYDENDKLSKFNDPIPIFPDFINNKEYTDKGFMFVTFMQDKCSYYIGDKNEDSCYKCSYYKKGEDLIGICKCEKNRKGDLLLRKSRKK